MATPDPLEALSIAAFTQGALAMFAMTDLRKILKVKQVHQGVDQDGNYEHHFIIETESGHQIEVKVRPIV